MFNNSDIDNRCIFIFTILGEELTTSIPIIQTKTMLELPFPIYNSVEALIDTFFQLGEGARRRKAPSLNIVNLNLH